MALVARGVLFLGFTTVGIIFMYICSFLPLVFPCLPFWLNPFASKYVCVTLYLSIALALSFNAYLCFSVYSHVAHYRVEETWQTLTELPRMLQLYFLLMPLPWRSSKPLSSSTKFLILQVPYPSVLGKKKVNNNYTHSARDTPMRMHSTSHKVRPIEG